MSEIVAPPVDPLIAGRKYWKDFQTAYCSDAWHQRAAEFEQDYFRELEADAKKYTDAGHSLAIWKANRGITDLYYLSKYILGYSDLTFRLHYPLCQFMNLPGIDHRLVLWPRKFFKTTICVISHTIQRLLQNPDLAILYATGTASLVPPVIKEMKNHFMRGQIFRSLYPQWCPTLKQKEWGTETEFTVVARRIYRKEPSIYGGSIESDYAGFSFDDGKFDDLVNEGNYNTPGQLEKVDTWCEMSKFLFKDQAKRRLDETGTRYHFGDHNGKVLVDDNMEKGGTAACYVQLPTHKGEAVFPERFSLKVLETMRGTTPKQHALYAAQMEQNPISADSTVTPDCIVYAPEKSEAELKRCYITLHLDAASGKNERSDYSAFVVVAATPDGFVDPIEYTRKKLNEGEFVKELFRLWDKYKPLNRIRSITLQKNVLENVFKNSVNEEMVRRNEYLPFHSVIVHGSGRDKDQRIARMTPRWIAKKVRIRPHMTELETERLHYPKGAHADLIDALSDFEEDPQFPPSDHEPQKQKPTQPVQRLTREVALMELSRSVLAAVAAPVQQDDEDFS